MIATDLARFAPAALICAGAVEIVRETWTYASPRATPPATVLAGDGGLGPP